MVIAFFLYKNFIFINKVFIKNKGFLFHFIPCKENSAKYFYFIFWPDDNFF